MKNELKVFVGDLQRHYYNLDADQQEKLQVRTAQVVCLGVLITISGTIYSYVPILIRVIALPLAVVLTWHFAGKMAKEKAFGRLFDRLKHAPTLAVLGGLMMVAFLFAGFVWGAR